MNKILLAIVAVIAIVALLLGVLALGKTRENQSLALNKTLAEKVLEKGSIKIGYVVYPPLLIKDPNTGALSGISYDVIEEMATSLGLKTEWAEETSWGSMIEGLKTERYDMIGTLIWPNSARAREAVFSTPTMYSVVYTYVRANDIRFDDDLTRANSTDVTIATIDGEMTSFIAKSDFSKAKTNSLPQSSSVSEVLTNVISNKADLTFVEPAIANDFLRSHPGAIKQVGIEPVRIFENVLAVKRGENDFISMLNVALKELISDKTVKRSIEKYNALNSFGSVVSPVSNDW